MDDLYFDSQDVQDFWNGYDSPTLSSPSVHRLTSSVPSVAIFPPTESTWSAPASSHELKILPVQSEEDSYWASYGTVQGTADSTVPSPRIQPKPHQPVDDYGRLLLHADEGIGELKGEVANDADLVYDLSHSHDSYPDDDRIVLATDAFAPPHQRALALALAQASPRPPPNFDVEEEDVEDDNSQESSSPSTVESSSSDIDLKMAIRGMYNLWKSGSKLEGEASREAFLAAVNDALDP